MKPIDAAWRVLKEDFDLQAALDANIDPNDPMKRMLDSARLQNSPGVNLQPVDTPRVTQYPRSPRNPSGDNRIGMQPAPPSQLSRQMSTRQTTLPSELTAGANVSDIDFRDMNMPSRLFQQ